MNHTFLLIDDDISIRKMLRQIITDNQLGRVVNELSSGKDAVEEILFFHPDVVVIDMLLPVQDGLQIVSSAQQSGYKGKFVMISQVEDPSVVGKAYQSGIVFFISKPINNIEVVSVLNQITKTIDMERSIHVIKNTVFNMEPSILEKVSTAEESLEARMQTIFSDIGIINETGSKDLRLVLQKILNHKKHSKDAPYTLQDMYKEVLSERDEKGDYMNIRSFEQRIRRLGIKALGTIAELGAEDYYNIKFMDYSTILFDLKEVKREIAFISGESTVRGKINVKRFVEGFCSKLT